MTTEKKAPKDDELWERRQLTRRIGDRVGEARSFWYESPADVQEGLRRAAEREMLLRWVARQMKRRLNAQERKCVKLHYLEGKTFRELGEEMEMASTAVARIVDVAIAKLRAVARKRERARKRSQR